VARSTRMNDGEGGEKEGEQEGGKEDISEASGRA
jgi:hypothetical protein